MSPQSHWFPNGTTLTFLYRLSASDGGDSVYFFFKPILPFTWGMGLGSVKTNLFEGGRSVLGLKLWGRNVRLKVREDESP
jgi:hypothetical protein